MRDHAPVIQIAPRFFDRAALLFCFGLIVVRCGQQFRENRVTTGIELREIRRAVGNIVRAKRIDQPVKCCEGFVCDGLSTLMLGRQLVEAAGVEPASENRGNRVSTCLAFHFVSSASPRKAWNNTDQPRLISGDPSRHPDLPISP